MAGFSSDQTQQYPGHWMASTDQSWHYQIHPPAKNPAVQTSIAHSSSTTLRKQLLIRSLLYYGLTTSPETGSHYDMVKNYNVNNRFLAASL